MSRPPPHTHHRTNTPTPTTATHAGDRLHSFCDASLRAPNPTMMVVPDTLRDARFQASKGGHGGGRESVRVREA